MIKANKSLSISKDTPTAKSDSNGAIYQPAIGETIANGRYKITSYLGQGGMGQVYKGTDTVLNRIVAVKLLNYGRLEGKQAIRFQQEAKALSNLSNDGILSVYDFGLTENDFPFMATEFIDGITLRNYLETNSTLDPQESISIAIQIAKAMNHAHRNNIIHRDLKPENIILANVHTAPTVKILDFGISKIMDPELDEQFQTPSGQIVGSPKYISPEQAGNLKTVDNRSDIYSLGCILFECLTGSPPFVNKNRIDTIEAHISKKAPSINEMSKDSSFTSNLEELVSKCLNKAPEDRYQSMAHLLDSLEEALKYEVTPLIEDELEGQIDSNTGYLSGTNKVAFVFITVLVSLAATVIIYIMVGPKSNTIGEILSSKNEKAHNRLDVSRDLARRSLTFKENGKDAKFKSYSDAIPIIALDELKSKKYSSIEFKSSGVEVGLLAELARRLPNLRKLTLYGCSITNSDISAINNFKKLKALILKDCNLNDSALENLKQNSKFTYLSIEKNPQITKVSLAKIIRLYPNLTELDIGKTGIKPEDLYMLKKLSKIIKLDIQRLNLNDDDLDVIASLPNVSQIDLGHNEEITINGLKKFSIINNRRVTLKIKDLFRISDEQMKAFMKTHKNMIVKDFYSKSSNMYRQRLKDKI